VSSNVTTRELDGVSIGVLQGRIVFGEESDALRARVKSLMVEGKRKIVLDMKQVEYIDSAGLGMLVAVHLRMKTDGASMCLCNLGTKFQEVLKITKLATVFHVCSTEATAVASFSG
jgi:anti-sigma B factor antagonist